MIYQCNFRIKDCEIKTVYPCRYTSIQRWEIAISSIRICRPQILIIFYNDIGIDEQKYSDKKSISK